MATLWPGNVVVLDYQLIPSQLLFGRLLFNGQPLTGGRINGGLLPGSTVVIRMLKMCTIDLADAECTSVLEGRLVVRQRDGE